MRISTGMEGLGDFLSNSLKALDIEHRVLQETCILLWDEVVGKQIANASQPEFVKDGRMFVTVKSSVWANELSLYKAEIIARLNKRIGRPVLKDIIMKVGSVKKRAHVSKPSERPKPNLEGIELTQDELDMIESAVASSDEAVAESTRKLLTTAKQIEKWKQIHGWTPCKKCGVLQNTASGVCPPCQLYMQER